MDLIRLLLLQVEGEEPKPDLSGFTEDERIYHSALLIETGGLFMVSFAKMKWGAQTEPYVIASLGKAMNSLTRLETIKPGERRLLR